MRREWICKLRGDREGVWTGEEIETKVVGVYQKNDGR